MTMVPDSVVDKVLARSAHRPNVWNPTTRLVDARLCGINGTSEHYDVAAFSTAGLIHRVWIDDSADGISAHCNCTGNQPGKLCRRVAVALEASWLIAAEELRPDIAAPDLGSAQPRAKLSGE